jgi:hypothetical protein
MSGSAAMGQVLLYEVLSADEAVEMLWLKAG